MTPEGTLTVDEAKGVERSTPAELTDRRDLMKLPIKERLLRLRADSEIAANDYIEDTEWLTLLGGDRLPE